MDAATYFENRPPSFKKRSKISPFGSDILTYKNRGYTLVELQEFLASNGIMISLAGISAYIRRIQLQSVNEAKNAATTSSVSPLKAGTKLTASATISNHNRPANFGSFPIKPDTKDL